MRLGIGVANLKVLLVTKKERFEDVSLANQLSKTLRDSILNPASAIMCSRSR